MLTLTSMTAAEHNVLFLVLFQEKGVSDLSTIQFNASSLSMNLINDHAGIECCLSTMARLDIMCRASSAN